jgi:ABC-type phosphate transport system auxiliary subunit
MSFTDKAKDLAKKTADAAQKGVNDTRDKGEKLMLQRKLNSLAEDLGHEKYRQHEWMTGLDEEFNRLVREMKALHAEIDAIPG